MLAHSLSSQIEDGITTDTVSSAAYEDVVSGRFFGTLLCLRRARIQSSARASEQTVANRQCWDGLVLGLCSIGTVQSKMDASV